MALNQGQISVKVPLEWIESKRTFVNYLYEHMEDFILCKEWEGANSSHVRHNYNRVFLNL